MVEASKAYVRIIIRRPHAYEFKAKHKDAPIPGIVILDADGALVGKHNLQGDDAAAKLLELLKK